MVSVRLTVAAFVAIVATMLGAGSAFANAPAPGWQLDSFASPTTFSASHNARCASEPVLCDAYHVVARNAGVESTDSSAVVLTDALPAGLTVQRVALFSSSLESVIKETLDLGPFLCTTTPVRCEYPGFVPPFASDETLKMIVYVTVDDPKASGALTNAVTIGGGGAGEASTSVTNQVNGPQPPFGVSGFDFYMGGLDGARDTQAGAHPYEVTTTLDLNSAIRESPERGTVDTSVQDMKDVVVDLPLGFVGSTLAAPECTFAQLSSKLEKGVSGCPPNTVVGHIRTEPESATSIDSDIYNMVPEAGVPAEFVYVDGIAGPHVFYVHVVPTPGGYVLQTINPDIPQIALKHIVVTFYGDPALRDNSGNAQTPFFTDPTGCVAGPLTATIYVDSWQNPGRYNPDGTPDYSDPAWVSSGEAGRSVSPPVTGCNALQFTPEIGAQPTTRMADTPSGFEFEIRLTQQEETGTLATPVLKKAVVKLPPGFTVDPSAGDGLGACSEAQIGWVGPSAMNFNPARPQCPENSKIGSLELSTPLLPQKLTGALYLARQEENPFKSLLASYVVVDDPVTGVLVKIAGELLLDPATGQLTAVFDENPQLPFSDLKLHFFGGPRAELATPQSCGTFTTHSELTPWSAPDSGPIGTPSDDFVIDENCGTGFSPSFTAGSTNLQAGAFSPFVFSFSRSDSDQELAGLTVSLPPGLLARVGSVPLCSDADANAGTCPASSQIGTIETGVGPGPNPLFVAGKAYLTGPYKGGPYGVAVVVPAVAGPFNFGTVVVRQSIRVDRTDAHVIAVSDPFPTIIDGIPLRLRRVDLHLDRPEFTFNPTNCTKQAFSGSLTSTQGASSPLGASFQVTNCATLGFKPQFRVSTAGKTSRANGAGLSVKLTYPNARFGSQANIKSVKVDLPRQLPSRLTTLQKACPDRTFEQNPASCPADSRVGTATATTPVMPVVLSGPAYFVSHGGAKFPELIIVLTGDNIRVDLHGETFISKAGITSSTFRQVPDVPIGAFDLTLPQGSDSALAANGNLCRSTLKMPTAFTAQNGAVIKQSTPIAVTGCPKKARKARRASRHRNRTTTHGKRK
jgi:hypothetical protein